MKSKKQSKSKTLSDTPTGRMGSMGGKSKLSGDTPKVFQSSNRTDMMWGVVEDKYQGLIDVFRDAVNVAKGSGADAHALSGHSFVRQPIVDIGLRLRSVGVGFQLGQAEKKSEEAALHISNSEKLYARQELLGAINYLAAAIICMAIE
jgi:hypothetical protein